MILKTSFTCKTFSTFGTKKWTFDFACTKMHKILKKKTMRNDYVFYLSEHFPYDFWFYTLSKIYVHIYRIGMTSSHVDRIFRDNLLTASFQKFVDIFDIDTWFDHRRAQFLNVQCILQAIEMFDHNIHMKLQGCHHHPRKCAIPAIHFVQSYYSKLNIFHKTSVPFDL